MKRDTIIGVGLQTYDTDDGNPVVLVSFLNTNFTINKTVFSGSTGSEPECASQPYTLVDNFNLRACI